MQKIRCTECGLEYDSFKDIPLIVDIQNRNEHGEWISTGRILYEEGMSLEKQENERYVIFQGCGQCFFEDFLTDNDKKEGKE